MQYSLNQMSINDIKSSGQMTLKTCQNFLQNRVKSQQESEDPLSKGNIRDSQPQMEPFLLAKIVKKYKVKNITKSFITKLKRNNTAAMKNEFQLKSQQEQNQQRLIKLKGVTIKYKWIESLVLFGDIVMSLFVFYISVLQAFVEGFRQEQYNSHVIMTLKLIAIIFQFSKITLKSVKTQYNKGARLDYITDIIMYSTGLFDLFIYVSAITIILITLITKVTKTIGIISLAIAFIKVYKTSENMKVLEVFYINSTRKQQYWNLIKVVIFNMFFGHLIAGILIGISDFNGSNNWISYHHLQNKEWEVVYSWAVYWSATMITTTGFGDYAATNQQQALVIAILEFGSSVVLVYNINLIGTIVMQIRDADQATEKKLAVFRRMNDQTPINTFLERKIHSYIEFQKNLHQLFEFQQRFLLMQEIPHQLKLQYFNEVNQTIFKNLPFFRHLRSQTMNMLANSFQCSVLYPSEYIVKNKIGKEYVFILKRGKIGLAYHKLQSSINGTIVEEINTNSSSSFSQMKDPPVLLTHCFLSRTKQINYDLVAIDYSLIMKIKQSDMINIIRESEIDKEYYFTIYDKQEINFIFKNQQCLLCPKEYHNKFQCPKLHFMPFKSLVTHKYIKEVSKVNPPFRQFKRNYFRKQHCYYLRKEFFAPYEEMKAIKSQKLTNKKILGMEFDDAFKQAISNEHISKQDFLQKCETIFRKVFDEKFEEESKDQTALFRIQLDSAHNYLSYFNECNSDKLLHHRISKKRLNRNKHKTKFQLLGIRSNQYIYRKSCTMWQIQREKELECRSMKNQRNISLKIL